ncbi:hypothetical protein [Stenotrophomonas acidaminiphila]
MKSAGASRRFFVAAMAAILRAMDKRRSEPLPAVLLPPSIGGLNPPVIGGRYQGMSVVPGHDGAAAAIDDVAVVERGGRHQPGAARCVSGCDGSGGHRRDEKKTAGKACCSV